MCINKCFIYIIVLQYCRSVINSVFVHVARDPYCLFIEPKLQQPIVFVYEAEVNHVNTFSVTFTPQQQPAFTEKTAKKKLIFNSSVEICFKSKSYNKVSFESYQNGARQMDKLAEKNEIFQLIGKLREVGIKIKERTISQVFEKERQNIYGRAIEQYGDWLGQLIITKLVFVLMIFGLQVWGIRKILRRNQYEWSVITNN